MIVAQALMGAGLVCFVVWAICKAIVWLGRNTPL